MTTLLAFPTRNAAPSFEPLKATVVFDNKGRALYFSKEVIPYTNNNSLRKSSTRVYHHIGVYAYKKEALESYFEFLPSHLEVQEGLEQLRFIENGVHIKCIFSSLRGKLFWELNNPNDVKIIEKILRESNN